MIPTKISTANPNPKIKWLPGYLVQIHSDNGCTARIWCEKRLEQTAWVFKPWTGSSEHTFYFESEELAWVFIAKFGL